MRDISSGLYFFFTNFFKTETVFWVFLHQNIKIEEIAAKLNNIEPSINFTYEKEFNNTISFLDILIIKSQSSLTFKVYRKPTNWNGFIDFYSHHNNKIKTGLIIGFYLRVLWIWCPQYLKKEFEYVEHSLKSLKYTKVFILNARKKNS